MFGDLSKYGFLNAKIRSKIGNIISDKEFEELRSNKNYYEIIDFLKEREYISSEIKYKNIKNIEFELFSYLVGIYKEIYNYINERNLKKFIFKLMEKLEIENLKNILRLWYKKGSMQDLEPCIYKKKICYNIPVEKLLISEDIDEFSKYLSETPYSNYMKSGIDNFKQTNTLFSLEVSLDKGYFNEIFSSLSLLTKKDRSIVKKFFGFEIDIQNIIWLIRYKSYYNLDVQYAIENIIPFGRKFSNEFLTQLFLSEEMKEDFLKVFTGLPSYITEQFTQKIISELNLRKKIQLIEDILNQIVMKEIKNTLTGYPFTIGIIIVYLLLKWIEIKNIIGVLNLKYYEVI